MNIFDMDKQKSFHGQNDTLKEVRNRPKCGRKWTQNRTQSYVFYKRDNIRPRANTVRLLDSLDRYSEVDRM